MSSFFWFSRPLALTAQVARQVDIPLKNWSTPLYWQPNQTERATAGEPAQSLPQLQFSANAVSTDALTFVAITPCRLVDTRGGGGFNGISPFSGPSIAAKGASTIPVQSPTEATANTAPAPCGMIPSIAQAYSFNLTVVPHAGGAVDYVTLWPAGGAQPFVATLNDPQGASWPTRPLFRQDQAPARYGGISVYNAGPATTDVVIDMNGYFAAPTDLNGNTAIGSGHAGEQHHRDDNTASGYDALYEQHHRAPDNTASGDGALQTTPPGATTRPAATTR